MNEELKIVEIEDEENTGMEVATYEEEYDEDSNSNLGLGVLIGTGLGVAGVVAFGKVREYIRKKKAEKDENSEIEGKFRDYIEDSEVNVTIKDRLKQKAKKKTEEVVIVQENPDDKKK